VRFLEGDFTRVATLKQAGILRAQTCIILADDRGGRSEQDADARTILAALTVEKLNADVYTCAELINRSYGTHLQMGHVNDFVVSGEHGAYLLAQAAMNRGLMAVYTELMTHQHGQQLYRLPLPDAWADREFNDVMAELKQRHDAILVAVHSSDGQFHVNPREYRFTGSDDIVVIAETQPRLGGG